jgi:hypothetical protein
MKSSGTWLRPWSNNPLFHIKLWLLARKIDREIKGEAPDGEIDEALSKIKVVPE